MVVRISKYGEDILDFFFKLGNACVVQVRIGLFIPIAVERSTYEPDGKGNYRIVGHFNFRYHDDLDENTYCIVVDDVWNRCPLARPFMNYGLLEDYDNNWLHSLDGKVWREYFKDIMKNNTHIPRMLDNEYPFTDVDFDRRVKGEPQETISNPYRLDYAKM